MSRISFRIASASLALAMPFAASAWNRPLDTAARLDVDVTHTSGNDAGRFWAIGASPGGNALLHYAGGTAPAATTWQPGDIVVATRTTPQGDLVLLTTAGDIEGCHLSRIGTDARVRWRVTLPTPNVPCGSPRLDNAGLWLADDGTITTTLGDGVRRYAADGSLRGDGPPLGLVRASDPRSGMLYAARTLSNGQIVVSAYSPLGTPSWHTGVDGSGANVAVAHDGSIRAAIARSDGLYAVSLAAAGGAVAWTTPLGAVTAPNADLFAPIVDASGATFIVDGSPSDAAIKLDAGGRLLWRASRASLGIDANAAFGDARLAPNGDVVLTHGDRVTRLATDGMRRYGRSIAPVGATVAIVGFDTDANVVVHRVGAPPQASFARLAVDGAELPAPVADDALPEQTTARRATLADGSIVAWTLSQNGARELIRYGADGRLLWRRVATGTWVSLLTPLPAGAVVAAGDRVCTLAAQVRDGALVDQVVTCHRADDGSVVWTRKVLERGDAWTSATGQLHLA
ncbi:MAG TPA: hypothetical protein VJ724_08690, partial [Tahibacter sp.]|nr:hypothetical protein [Tahibacter sp.]